MDRTTGDGADSAEDSGSSQSYPSTLPGIPKACNFFFRFSFLVCVSLFFNSICKFVFFFFFSSYEFKFF